MQTKEGTTRKVILHGNEAVKFAKNDDGRKANIREAFLWARYKEHPLRSQMLCPVLWHADDGAVLIMKRAEQVSTDFDFLQQPDWDYLSNGDDPCPFEPKGQDWGLLEGRIVAVDYGIDA